VIAIAPAAYISEDHCGTVRHLVSKNDFIPWIDFVGRWKNRENVVVIDRHPDASYFDHAVKSSTYADKLQKRIIWIRENYGDLKE
jgi:hypothetical protein